MNDSDVAARLAVQLRRAFFDNLEATMRDEPAKGAEYLVKLHAELVERFKSILPTLARELDEYMDHELFAQQVRAGSFQSDSMVALVDYTYRMLRTACAPDQDTEVAASLDRVRAVFVPGVEFAQLVPLFLKEVHVILDEITRRIIEFNNYNKAREET